MQIQCIIRKLTSAETKCNFRSFRAVKSFWTKQQSFISKKVGHQKWCPFFDFVCFSGCHFTKSGLFQKQIGNRGVFLALCMYLMVIIDNSSLFCLYIFVLEDLAFFPTVTAALIQINMLSNAIRSFQPNFLLVFHWKVGKF